MIVQELEVSLYMVFMEVCQVCYEFIMVEYLLLVLLDNLMVVEVLCVCVVNIEDLCQNLCNFIYDNIFIVLGIDDVDIQLMFGFQCVIQCVIMYVQLMLNGKKEVIGVNVLVVIFGEKDLYVVYYLQQQGVMCFDVVNFILYGIVKMNNGEVVKLIDVNVESEDVNVQKEMLFVQFMQNLNQMVKDGCIDLLIGCEFEVECVVQVLCCCCKNNLLFVGEVGVGKIVIVEGFVYWIMCGEVLDIFVNVQVYLFDMGVLFVGIKYCGDFEQCLKMVFKELKECLYVILFIDEIYMLIGVGVVLGGMFDVLNLLKLVLLLGMFKCIGVMMFIEYCGIFEKDVVLLWCFQKVDVMELSVEQMVVILCGLKLCFEEYYGVKYLLGVLLVVVELLVCFIIDCYLLDKVIDVIDEVGVVQCILLKLKQKKMIGKSEIEEIILKIVCVLV